MVPRVLGGQAIDLLEDRRSVDVPLCIAVGVRIPMCRSAFDHAAAGRLGPGPEGQSPGAPYSPVSESAEEPKNDASRRRSRHYEEIDRRVVRRRRRRLSMDRCVASASLRQIGTLFEAGAIGQLT